MQKLITFIVAALMIYVVMNEKFAEMRKKPSTPDPAPAGQEDITQQPNAQMQGNFLEKSLSTMLVNVLKTDEGRTFFEHLIQPANKPLTGQGFGLKLDNSQLVQSMFKIKTSGTRKEGPASCGHVITAHYQITTLTGALVEDDIKTFPLGGTKDMMAGLADIIVGMYVGEIREGIVSPPYSAGAKDPTIAYKVKVELQSIIPKVFADNVKIFDDEIAYKTPYLCGEKAVFDVKISRCSGDVVYDSQKNKHKIDMVLGDMAYPMIFSHALFAKVPLGTRTVIAQGKHLRSLATTNINRIFEKEQLPPEEFFLVEFKNFQEPKEAQQEHKELQNPKKIMPEAR